MENGELDTMFLINRITVKINKAIHGDTLSKKSLKTTITHLGYVNSSNMTFQDVSNDVGSNTMHSGAECIIIENKSCFACVLVNKT